VGINRVVIAKLWREELIMMSVISDDMRMERDYGEATVAEENISQLL